MCGEDGPSEPAALSSKESKEGAIVVEETMIVVEVVPSLIHDDASLGGTASWGS